MFSKTSQKIHHPKTAKDLQRPTVKPKQQEFAGQSLNVKILSEELGATELKLALLTRF